MVLLNRIDRSEYNHLKKLIPRTEYNHLKKLIPINYESYKLIIEESSSNFGHENIIIQGDIHFPNAISFNNKNNNQYGGYNTYNLNIPNIDKNYFNKQEYLKGIDIKPSSENFFKLYRYGMSSNNYLHKPNNRDGPTFSISLFMPNANIYKKSYSSWTSKYFSNQIKNILVLKYYFPNCNIRVYFDWYMLEKGFSTLSGNDESLILTKQIKNFQYDDFEEEKQEDVRTYLSSFYNILKQYDNYPYKNGMERFIHCYHLASIVNNVNLNAELTDVPGDFFVYKLSGPFIEKINTPNEGHITNGYIGQQMRYISLKQIQYEWNGQTIGRPKHLVWRDAHANGTAYNDYLWIKEMNDFSNNKKAELYLVPTSINYTPQWNDIVKCTANGKYMFRSAVAGIVQFVNSTDTIQFLSDDIYNRSVGITFLLDKDGKLPLLKHRHPGYNNEQKEYGYGIDEYVNSSFFNLDQMKQKSVYFTHYFSWSIFDNDTFNVIELLLLKYLIKENKIKDKISRFEFTKKIEELRNDKKLSNNNELRLILSIYPNKYHYSNSIFSSNNDERDVKFYNKEQLGLDGIINLLEAKIKDKQYTNDLTFENLEKLNITCKNTALSSSIEWCTYPYLEKQSTTEKLCPPANYYSGFYYDNPPSLDIGILRQPSDLIFAYEGLLKNKLRIPLNKSDYKLIVEKDTFMKDTFKNVDDSKCHIKPALQNIILEYGQTTEFGISKAQQIAQNVAKLNPKGIAVSQSDVWVPLIWKALNYVGYDVKPECFDVKLNNYEEYNKFNEYVKELATLPGWAKYAAYILINDTDNYGNDDNKFDSEKVKQKSVMYSAIPDVNHDKYKMASYQKYLRYKKKYLQLKQLLKQ